MPTEELFGAYRFLLEVAGSPPKDSFAFKAEGERVEAALLLPVVQAAREAARSDNAALEPLDALLIINELSRSTVDGGHDKWIDVLSTDWGMDKPGGKYPPSGLRSDGDLVQAVSEVDLGGDFIL